MNDIDARITTSNTRCRIEPVSDTARQWLEHNVLHQTCGNLRAPYLFGPVQGRRIHDDMLKAGMTLHIIQVSYQH